MTLLYGKDANGNQVPLLVSANGTVQTSGLWSGTASQLTAGNGSAVTVGSGLTLAAGTLTASGGGGSLPASGDYTWIPSGAGPYANQGTAGVAVATAGTTTSASSAGLWSSGRTGLRGYASNISTDGVLNASNAFSAAWQNASFTFEAYFQVDYELIVVAGKSFAMVLNDFGIGANAIYISSGTGSTTQGHTLEVWRNASQVATAGITAGLMNSRPVHLAVVFDRSNSSAVTATAYVDGLVAATLSLGSLAAFTNPFTQVNIMLGGAGIVGWVNLTQSAKTAAQIRANTLLLKAA